MLTRAETTLLPAFGIDPQDIVWIDGRVTVSGASSVAPPMWHNAPPFYVHPGDP